MAVQKLANGVTAQTGDDSLANKITFDAHGKAQIPGYDVSVLKDGTILASKKDWTTYTIPIVVGSIFAYGAATAIANGAALPGATSGSVEAGGATTGTGAAASLGSSAFPAGTTAATYGVDAAKKAVDTRKFAQAAIDALDKAGPTSGAAADVAARNRLIKAGLETTNSENRYTAEHLYQTDAEARAEAVRTAKQQADHNAITNDYAAHRDYSVGIIPATSPEARASAAASAADWRARSANPYTDLPEGRSGPVPTDVKIDDPGMMENIDNGIAQTSPWLKAFLKNYVFTDDK